MSLNLAVRLPDTLGASLQPIEEETQLDTPSLVARAVDEWLRMNDHPRIRFTTLPSGQRMAALVQGPEVWSVAKAWNDLPQGSRTTADMEDATGLSESAVRAALQYYFAFKAEIDAELDNLFATADRLEAEWLNRVGA